MVEDVQIKYRVNSQKATQLIVAGLAAVGVMLVLSYLLRSIGIAAPDFGAQYGAIFNSQTYPPAFSGRWWTGIVWHLVDGILILPFLYDYLAHRKVLPNMRFAKGFLYGAGIWIFTGLIIGPLAGEGIFFENTPSPFVLSFTNLICWLTYSLVLDGMTRVRVVHELRIAEKRAA